MEYFIFFKCLLRLVIYVQIRRIHQQMHSNSVEMRGNGISITRKDPPHRLRRWNVAWRAHWRGFPALFSTSQAHEWKPKHESPHPLHSALASFRIHSLPGAFLISHCRRRRRRRRRESHIAPAHDKKSFRSPSHPYTSPTVYDSYIMNISII